MSVSGYAVYVELEAANGQKALISISWYYSTKGVPLSPYRIEPLSRVKAVALSRDDEFKAYLDRLLKMIPAEVIGLYLVGSGVIPETKPAVLTFWAAVCLIGVIVVRAYGTSDPARGRAPQWTAVILACIAFVIWVYTLGGPFKAYGLYEPYV